MIFVDNKSILWYNKIHHRIRKEVVFLEYKTVKQVADELQLSEETIRRKIRSGELDAYMTGKSYRISRRQLKDFLKENSKESA